MTRQYSVKWCCGVFPVVRCVERLRQQLYILLSVWLMFDKYQKRATIVLLKCANLTFVSGWYAVLVRCLETRRTVTAAKNFDTNCDPFLARKGDVILYEMTQVLKNAIVPFIEATVMNGTALVNWCFSLSRKSHIDCRISFWVTRPECPLSQDWAFLWLEIEAASFDDVLLSLLQCTTDIWLPLCLDH